MGMVTIQLIQDLDNIGIGIGATEGVASPIETQYELVWLFGWQLGAIGNARHCYFGICFNDAVSLKTLNCMEPTEKS